jgi:hypothetical protein
MKPDGADATIRPRANCRRLSLSLRNISGKNLEVRSPKISLWNMGISPAKR